MWEEADNYSYYYSTGSSAGGLDFYLTDYDLVIRLENTNNPNFCAMKDPGGTEFCNLYTWPGWN